MYNSKELNHILCSLRFDSTFKKLENSEKKTRYLIKKHHSTVIKHIQDAVKIYQHSEKSTRRGQVHSKGKFDAEDFVELCVLLGKDSGIKHAEETRKFMDHLIENTVFSFDATDPGNNLQFMIKVYIVRALTFIATDNLNEYRSDTTHALALLALLKSSGNPMIDEGNLGLSLLLLLSIVLIRFIDMTNEPLDWEQFLEKHFFEDAEQMVFYMQAYNWQQLFKILEHHLKSVPQYLEKLEAFEEYLGDLVKYKKATPNFQMNYEMKLESTPGGGRCYVADVHIGSDVTMLVEKPMSTVIFAEHIDKFCSNCQHTIFTGVPCMNCNEMQFCSVDCSIIANKEAHRYECGVYKALLGSYNYYTVPHAVKFYGVTGLTKTLNDIQRVESERLGLLEVKTPKTGHEIAADYLDSEGVREKNFSEMAEQDKVIYNEAIDSLLAHRWSREIERDLTHTIWALNIVALFIYRGRIPYDFIEGFNLGKLAALTDRITELLMQICTNGFCWMERINPEDQEGSRIGSCICFVGSFFNHSCTPNVTWRVDRNYGLVMTSSREIRQNEPLTICYGPRRTISFDERQKRLKEDYCFFCQCELCMAEAAEKPTTLQCWNKDCEGPIVLNRYHSCLRCGFKANSAEYQAIDSTLSQSMEKFTKLFKKFQLKHGVVKRTLWNKIVHYSAGRMKKNTRKMIQNVLPERLRSSNMSETVLCKMEKNFVKIRDRAYNHSFVLLDFVIMMLKAYQLNDTLKVADVFEIADLANKILLHATPEEIHHSRMSEKLLENFEYCSSFLYEYLKRGDIPLGYRGMLNEIQQRIDMRIVDTLKMIGEGLKKDENSGYVKTFMQAQFRLDKAVVE